MVLPFLSLYLTEDMSLTLSQVGWIMSTYGLGSFVGSWIGGKLTDRIGFYHIIHGSLITAGGALLLLQLATTFESFCLGVFLLVAIGDTFRPALFVAIRAYSKPENRTRSLTLIRLAINLGFSIGPALGGLVITAIGYHGLFWIDGLTCMAAGLLFIAKLNKKESNITRDNNVNTPTSLSPYRDRPYMLFLVVVALVGLCFMQYFSTVPLYYHDVHHLSESYIGLLLGLNGFVIFFIEMPLIKYVEQPRFSTFRTLAYSTLMIAASFLILNLGGWVGLLWMGMLLMTVGEMLNFPLANSFALQRSERGKAGAYMAVYTIAWSVSHIVGHNLGMQLVDHLGYTFTWYVMTVVLVLSAGLTMWLGTQIDRETA